MKIEPLTYLVLYDGRPRLALCRRFSGVSETGPIVIGPVASFGVTHSNIVFTHRDRVFDACHLALIEGYIFYRNMFWQRWRLQSGRPEGTEVVAFDPAMTSPQGSAAWGDVPAHLDAMARGFLETVIELGMPESPNAGDDKDAEAISAELWEIRAIEEDPWHPQAWGLARLMCWRFLEENRDICQMAADAAGWHTDPESGESRYGVYGWSRLGADLFLSGAGHGTGFFDRDVIPEPVREFLDVASRHPRYDSFAHYCLSPYEGRIAVG